MEGARMDEKVTLIDADSHVEGKLKGKNARILGRFKGEIELSGRLFTGEGSKVEAVASVESAEIAGQYDGEVKAKSVLLLEKASITGKLQTRNLAVREGARINGGVDAGQDAARPPAPEPQQAGAAGTGKG
jgi:cytoskeletal protein CcmA (bactofilin family)